MSAPIPSPGWEPSEFRSIVVKPASHLRSRGYVGAIVQNAWLPKSSADNLDYVFDPIKWLGDTDDVLRSISAQVSTSSNSPTDLKVVWCSIVDGKAVIYLGGGNPGTIQTVNVTLYTTSGRMMTQSIQVAINTNTAATEPETPPTMTSGVPIPPNAIQLPPDGNILVDEDGNPYLIS